MPGQLVETGTKVNQGLSSFQQRSSLPCRSFLTSPPHKIKPVSKTRFTLKSRTSHQHFKCQLAWGWGWGVQTCAHTTMFHRKHFCFHGKGAASQMLPSELLVSKPSRQGHAGWERRELDACSQAERPAPDMTSLHSN